LSNIPIVSLITPPPVALVSFVPSMLFSHGYQGTVRL
jgi:hypothetical protein